MWVNNFEFTHIFFVSLCIIKKKQVMMKTKTLILSQVDHSNGMLPMFADFFLLHKAMKRFKCYSKKASKI